ncbi:MAG: YkgJ family cysteine cluster protein [Candidatus Brocadiia bacterium]
MAEAWYKEGLRFQCTRCGQCCRGDPGYVWVDEAERVAIARHLKLSAEEFARRYLREVFGAYSLVELANGDCVFWTPEGCRIYPVRPVQCRTFPFWPEYVRSPRAWRRAARRCPGVGQGRLYTAAEVEELARRTDT